MKKKNIILSLTFLMTSIGTALGTTFYLSVPTYVHGLRQVIGGNPVETCSTLGNKCDGGTAGVTCLITHCCYYNGQRRHSGLQSKRWGILFCTPKALNTYADRRREDNDLLYDRITESRRKFSQFF
jgi:hypothetical protein